MSAPIEHVLLVGCGNMGFAMLTKWQSAGLTVSVVEPSAALRVRATDSGALSYASVEVLPKAFAPDLLVLAVKPQAIFEVLPLYSRFMNEKILFLSLAAGISIDAIYTALPKYARVVRCMPNTPASVGAGMMVCVASENVTDLDLERVKWLLSLNGHVAFVSDEALMDAVTAVSGSGPAYLFYFIECLAEAGRRAGLPAPLAEELALRTVSGAATLAGQSAKDPSTLRREVTSPGGTTAAALDVLMKSGRMIELIIGAVEAGRRRSLELGYSKDTRKA